MGRPHSSHLDSGSVRIIRPSPFYFYLFTKPELDSYRQAMSLFGARNPLEFSRAKNLTSDRITRQLPLTQFVT